MSGSEWSKPKVPYLSIFGGVNICLPAFRCSAEVHGLGPSPNPNVESQMLRFTLR